MDKLKFFIETNREAFDDELLPEGHLERFEQKLSPAPKKHVRLYGLCLFAAVASIAFLLLLRLPGSTIIPTQEEVAAQLHSEEQNEVKELSFYYNMQMNEIITQMDSLYKKDQTPGAAELLQETKRVLSANHMFEKTVLPTLPCSNDGLYAMNQHYSNSLESLNIMLKQMENINKEQQSKK